MQEAKRMAVKSLFEDTSAFRPTSWIEETEKVFDNPLKKVARATAADFYLMLCEVLGAWG